VGQNLRLKTWRLVFSQMGLGARRNLRCVRAARAPPRFAV
jgi:hypothetical protein